MKDTGARMEEVKLFLSANDIISCLKNPKENNVQYTKLNTESITLIYIYVIQLKNTLEERTIFKTTIKTSRYMFNKNCALTYKWV